MLRTRIETPRLLLRPLVMADLDNLVFIRSDPVTMRFWPSSPTAADVSAWLNRVLDSYAQHGFGRYIVALHETGQIIGDCGIMNAEIVERNVYDLGYIIYHPFQGKGYATEAAHAVKQHAFDTLKLNALHANMPHDHDASRRVAEKIGMTKIDEYGNPHNRNIRTFLYAVFREQHG